MNRIFLVVEKETQETLAICSKLDIAEYIADQFKDDGMDIKIETWMIDVKHGFLAE